MERGKLQIETSTTGSFLVHDGCTKAHTMYHKGDVTKHSNYSTVVVPCVRGYCAKSMRNMSPGPGVRLAVWTSESTLREILEPMGKLKENPVELMKELNKRLKQGLPLPNLTMNKSGGVLSDYEQVVTRFLPLIAKGYVPIRKGKTGNIRIIHTKKIEEILPETDDDIPLLESAVVYKMLPLETKDGEPAGRIELGKIEDKPPEGSLTLDQIAKMTPEGTVYIKQDDGTLAEFRVKGAK